MKKLKNKKVYLGIIIVLLGIFGCAMKSHLDGNGQAAPGGFYESPVAANNQAPAGEENNAESGAKATATPGSDGKPAPGNDSKPEPAAKNAGEKTSAGSGITSGLSNDRRGWGLKRNTLHQQPDMPSSVTAQLSRHGAYWIGSPDRKVVYLTFDEGYENGYTPAILDALKANGVRAAFFVTGHYLKSQPGLVRRMVDEGHIVGNHTENHPSLPEVSDEQIEKELRMVEERYEEVAGGKDMKYLRPPQGEYSERTLELTRDLGYHNIFWSFAMVDWVPLPGGAQEAHQTVMDNLHNGALLLLHAVSKDNAEAMDKMLKDIKAQGYSFGTLDDLVRG